MECNKDVCMYVYSLSAIKHLLKRKDINTSYEETVLAFSGS
jgi:hypothetical protein